MCLLWRWPGQRDALPTQSGPHVLGSLSRSLGPGPDHLRLLHEHGPYAGVHRETGPRPQRLRYPIMVLRGLLVHGDRVLLPAHGPLERHVPLERRAPLRSPLATCRIACRHAATLVTITYSRIPAQATP